MDVRPHDFTRLAPETEMAAFRNVQKAMTNVFRHSGTAKGWVDLVKEKSPVTVKVRDDGKGITDRIADLRPDSIGIGISGIKQRGKELGEELQLRDTPPGALVDVTIPI